MHPLVLAAPGLPVFDRIENVYSFKLPLLVTVRYEFSDCWRYVGRTLRTLVQIWGVTLH